MADDMMEETLIGGMMTIVMVAMMAQFVQAPAPQQPTTPQAPLGYQCPYCSATFATLDELVSHVASEHPDKPPIQPIDIIWT